MSYTPVELRHVKVGRSLFGYNRATVEQLIEEVAQSFEATWRERGELADKVESLEKQVDELRGREHLLTQTLVAAEQAASDVRERARREAETIVQEAHNEARAVGRAAHAERERLFVESKRIEGMLRAALGLIETETAAISAKPEPVPVQAAPPPEPVHAPEPTPPAVAEPVLEPELQHEPEPEPEPEREPELQRDLEPVSTPFVERVTAAVAYEEPAREPVVESRPPQEEHEGAPRVESEYGWTREDTREFEPISAAPEPDAEADDRPEEPSAPVAEPVLERIPGAGSRDFDWGE